MPFEDEILLHSPADIVAQMLIDLAVATDPLGTATDDVWPVFVSQEPSLPDSVITIYDTTGIIQGRAHVSGEMFERQAVSIRVRDANHQNGYQKISDISTALERNVYSETITISSNTYLVHAVSITSGPFSIGKETPQSKRNIFTLNATTTIRRTT